MNIDSYYEIGASHIVCEDHAIHGEFEGIHYIIGADGCSSSSGVDLGAGLLCHVAKKQIMILHKTLRPFDTTSAVSAVEIETILKNAIVQNCLEIKQSLRLGPTSFDATLWIVIMYQRKIFVFGWGDGAIIVKAKDTYFLYGKVAIKDPLVTLMPSALQSGEFITERRYDSGAPYYLSYKMDFQRDQDYHNMEPKGIYKVNEFYYTNSGKPEVTIFDVDSPYVHEIDLNKIDMKSITICSDGIKTYEGLTPDTVSPIDICTVAKDFVDYKNLIGRFVERKMLKLRKVYKEKNIVHLDDIFCATISFEE